MSERELSDIIECDGQLVIKLYSNDISKEMVEREMILTNLARNNGIPTPKIHELVKDGDRWGYSYEKVIGLTFLEMMTGTRSDSRSSGQLVRLLASRDTLPYRS